VGHGQTANLVQKLSACLCIDPEFLRADERHLVIQLELEGLGINDNRGRI
jgi:hypothetical protein